MTIDRVPSGWCATETPLQECHDVLLFDLDGVLYVGQAAVPYAAGAVAAARRRGLRAGFVTNNASRPPAQVAAHLSSIGIPATGPDVVTSAQAGARVLAGLVPDGSRVLFIGGEGVPVALLERGFLPVRTIDQNPAALIQGYGRDVGWEQLAQGSYALAQGLPWVATNTDRTIPTPHGRALGNGAMVAALSYATGATPVVAGKPEPPLMVESVERLAAEQPLVVGDRLDTDIQGANRCGIKSLLVLTGVTDWQELLDAPPMCRPSYLAADLRGLAHPQPEVLVSQSQDWINATCEAASARARLVPSGDTAKDPGMALAAVLADVAVNRVPDVIRVVVAAFWAASDAGMTVAELSVNP